jgi:hypothetical protein
MQCSSPVPAFRPAVLEERSVALVDVRGDQPGRLRVGAGHDQGGDAHDVGGQARGGQVALVRRRRDQHLAAQVAALLLGRQLVLEVDRRGARLDEGLHDLEAVQRPAEAGLGVGHDRREPVALGAAFGVFDLVGALERAVDPAAQLRGGVAGIERLVRVHGRGRVGVRRHLPAGKVDRLQAGADHLHRLVAGHRAQRVHERLLAQQLPQLVGAALGQGVRYGEGAAQAQHVGGGVGPLHPVEAARGRGRDQLCEVCHNLSPG